VQSLPLYLKVANEIKDMIYQGTLKPGDMLPSEYELATEFKMSRTTIRKGLSILLSEDYIISVPGKGYFVKEADVDRYILFFNERSCIENYSGQPKLLKVDIIKANNEIAFQLELKKEKRVIIVQWLHYADNRPAAYDVKYLPYDRGKPIVEEEIKYATLPEMFAKHTSLFAINKVLKIITTKPSPEIKKVLQLEENCPVILVEQKLLSQNQSPMGWGQLFIKQDYFNLAAYSSYSNRQEYRGG